MSASVDSVVISKADLREGVAAIQHFGAVISWVKAGKPEEDIEMHARNVSDPHGGQRYRPCYQKMLRKMQDKYKIEERDLALRLLQHMRAGG